MGVQEESKLLLEQNKPRETPDCLDFCVTFYDEEGDLCGPIFYFDSLHGAKAFGFNALKQENPATSFIVEAVMFDSKERVN